MVLSLTHSLPSLPPSLSFTTNTNLSQARFPRFPFIASPRPLSLSPLFNKALFSAICYHRLAAVLIVESLVSQKISLPQSHVSHRASEIGPLSLSPSLEDTVPFKWTSLPFL